jgi:hypothetical protein
VSTTGTMSHGKIRPLAMSATVGAFWFDFDPTPSDASTQALTGAEEQRTTPGLDSIFARIEEICQNPELREDGESAPSEETIRQSMTILEETSHLLGGAIPHGDAATYFGEISISWHHGNRFLRLACFSDGREPRMDYGLFDALSTLKHATGIDALMLSRKLEWLNKGLL